MRWRGMDVQRVSVVANCTLVVVLGCTVAEPEGPAASSSSASSSSSGMGPVGSEVSTAGPSPGSSTAVADSTGSSGCGAIAGEGFAVGQIAQDWTLMDASGSPVQLHDYCGQVIYLELGAEW